MTGSVVDVIAHLWMEAGKKVGKAVVFIDAEAAECLHWSGGVNLLKRAALLREFSIFESAPADYKKAVFVISSPIAGSVEETLKAIISTSSFHYCVVITTCHPAVTSFTNHPMKDWNLEDQNSILSLEENLLHWMGNVNMTAEVLHLPLSICAPCPSLLLSPPLCALIAPTSPDLERIKCLWPQQHAGQPPPSDPACWAALPLPLQTRLRQSVASLHSLLASLGAKEEIWSVGNLARSLGDQLEAWTPARTRRKTASNKVSLILVDRTLDFASCCPGAGDTLLARATDILPRLPQHSTDLASDLSRLFGLSASGTLLPAGIASPSLKYEDKEREEEELEALLFYPEKETLALLHRNLMASSPQMRRNEVGSKKVVSGAVLSNDLKDFQGDQDALLANLSTISRAQAAVTCLVPEVNLRRKKVSGLCAQYAQAIRQSGGAGLLAEVTDLVRGRKDAGLKLEDLLHILLYLYSALDVRDQFDTEEEERLRSVLGEALLKDSSEGELGEVLDCLIERRGGEMDELVALAVVDNLWERLEGLRVARDGLGAFHSLIGSEGGGWGLVEQLLGEVYRKEGGDVNGLYHHSQGLGAMLRSGLGWLGSAPSAPHPREAPLVILWVVGGVTAGEVALAKKAVAGTESKLTIGGSRVVSPRDALNLAFTHDCLA